MNYSRRVEANLAEFYELIPHLPKRARVWLANNAWRVALAGIVGCIVGMFWLIPAFIASVVINYMTGNLLSPVVPYENTQLSITWLLVLLMIFVSIVTVVVLALSVNKLRSKAKSGWNGLFYVVVLSIAYDVAMVMTAPSWWLLIAVVSGALTVGYLLFEIRSEFHHVVRSDHNHVNPE